MRDLRKRPRQEARRLHVVHSERFADLHRDASLIAEGGARRLTGDPLIALTVLSS